MGVPATCSNKEKESKKGGDWKGGERKGRKQGLVGEDLFKYFFLFIFFNYFFFLIFFFPYFSLNFFPLSPSQGC